MTREQTAERIKVMQAYVDGKKIQWAYDSTDIWFDTGYPQWKPDIDYRIKPEPKSQEQGNENQALPKLEQQKAPVRRQPL